MAFAAIKRAHEAELKIRKQQNTLRLGKYHSFLFALGFITASKARVGAWQKYKEQDAELLVCEPPSSLLFRKRDGPVEDDGGRWRVVERMHAIGTPRLNSCLLVHIF